MIEEITIPKQKTGLPGAGSIPVRLVTKKKPADTFTPVNLYLRLRDRFPGAVLLESAENSEGKNSRSFIALKSSAEFCLENDCAKITVPSCNLDMEIGVEPKSARGNLENLLEHFRKMFSIEDAANSNSGLIGYMTFESTAYFEQVKFREKEISVPLLRYALYRYLIIFDHLRHSIELMEQLLPGENSDTQELESLIANRDVPAFPFAAEEEKSLSGNETDFLENVKSAIAHCKRGDVFQLVLSRRFSRKFSGDEFNVYRALRMVNPSPYLFFADYGDYRIFGSSPEAQLIIQDDKAIVNPIAGTFRRTGDEAADRELETQLLEDPKENAEHLMLVDLARNDLSRVTGEVNVEAYREVHRYSHVIHLVSKVSGKLRQNPNVFSILGSSFPAGTLSGAPKIKAMELIDKYEPVGRGYYGGCIGFVGFDGSLNKAIMIRSFLSQNGELTCQAGAGIVVSSQPENELKEIDNKLAALRRAVELAEEISK